MGWRSAADDAVLYCFFLQFSGESVMDELRGGLESEATEQSSPLLEDSQMSEHTWAHVALSQQEVVCFSLDLSCQTLIFTFQDDFIQADPISDNNSRHTQTEMTHRCCKTSEKLSCETLNADHQHQTGPISGGFLLPVEAGLQLYSLLCLLAPPVAVFQVLSDVVWQVRH